MSNGALLLKMAAAATGGTPPDPPVSGLLAWYDPSDLSTLFQDTGGTIPVTAPGQNVRYMLDKSGNGNHVTYVAGTSITYSESGGFPHLVTVAAYMQTAAFAGVNAIPQVAMYTAWNVQTVNNAIPFVLCNAAITQAALEPQVTAPASVYVSPANVYTFNGSFYGAKKVCSFGFNGALPSAEKVSLRVDGAGVGRLSGATTATVTINAPVLRLFSFNTGGGGVSSQDFYGMSIYDTVLTGADLTEVEQYYADKSGVVLA